MTTFLLILICVFIVYFLYFFVVRPLTAIGDLPKCIDRLTKEVEELKEVLKNDRKTTDK